MGIFDLLSGIFKKPTVAAPVLPPNPAPSPMPQNAAVVGQSCSATRHAESPCLAPKDVGHTSPGGPSPHFSWEETFTSETARKLGIQNDWRITEAHRLAEFTARITYNCAQMEIVRGIVGQAINVNSMYRGWNLNAAVGGSQTSAHPQGLATDFTPSGDLVEICERLANELTRLGFKWDQIIQEGAWIHFSPAQNWDAKTNTPVGQRCQRMRMVGGNYYMGFKP